ncbi:MAG: hypothetical protein QUU85_00010, partial [Candidatus Eisenbacteria bacterium]|nr:hypothetical protein [Candidatus Eisenbacteria bacterium]
PPRSTPFGTRRQRQMCIRDSLPAAQAPLPGRRRSPMSCARHGAIVAFPVLALLLLVFAALADPPPISQETGLDHGFRYSYDATMAMAASAALSDSSVLFCWSEDSHVMAIPFGRSGESIGGNRTVLFEGSYPDLSSPDASGWKIAARGGGTLHVRNLDPVSLATTIDRTIGTTPGASIENPEIAKIGDAHVVAWQEAAGSTYALRMQRFDSLLEPLDPEPIDLGPCSERTCDLASTDSGGILIYVDGAGEAAVRLLGADGLPAGDPRPLDATETYDPEVAACPCGDGWFVAWSRTSGIGAAFLAADGSLLAPGILGLSPYPDYGMSASEDAEGGVLLAYREDGYAIWAQRLRAGVGAVGNPLILSGDAPYLAFGFPMDLREVACAWTGECFAVAWTSYHDPPVGGDRREGGGARDRNWFGAFPVYSQWVAPDGGLLYGNPFPINVLSSPAEATVVRHRDTSLAIVRDGMRGEWLHTLVLGPEGGVIETPARYRTAAEPDDCELWDCETWSIDQLAAARDGTGAAVGYRLRTHFSNEYYEMDAAYLVIDRLAADGSFLDRASSSLYIGNSELTSFAIVPINETRILAAYTADDWGGRAPESGYVQLLDWSTGEPMASWRLHREDNLTPVTGITAAPLPGGTRFLIAWNEGGALRAGVLDLDDPPDEIVGAVVPPSAPLAGRPRLIAGESQVPCAYPAERADGSDIEAVRFDAQGEPIDATPIVLCGIAGSQGNVDGTWDGDR